MTGPEDSHSGTRPISVAELLAKNGTIGAPPVGGRRLYFLVPWGSTERGALVPARGASGRRMAWGDR